MLTNEDIISTPYVDDGIIDVESAPIFQKSHQLHIVMYIAYSTWIIWALIIESTILKYCFKRFKCFQSASKALKGKKLL